MTQSLWGASGIAPETPTCSISLGKLPEGVVLTIVRHSQKTGFLQLLPEVIGFS